MGAFDQGLNQITNMAIKEGLKALETGKVPEEIKEAGDLIDDVADGIKELKQFCKQEELFLNTAKGKQARLEAKKELKSFVDEEWIKPVDKWLDDTGEEIEAFIKITGEACKTVKNKIQKSEEFKNVKREINESIDLVKDNWKKFNNWLDKY